MKYLVRLDMGTSNFLNDDIAAIRLFRVLLDIGWLSKCLSPSIILATHGHCRWFYNSFSNIMSFFPLDNYLAIKKDVSDQFVES